MSRLPTVNATQVVKALSKAGFLKVKQRGSHLRMYQPDIRNQTTIPIHPGDVPRALLKTIIKQAGLTEEQFRDLL